MPEKWDDVRVTVERPGPTDQAGPGANAIPQDDNKAVSIQPDIICLCYYYTRNKK